MYRNTIDYILIRGLHKTSKNVSVLPTHNKIACSTYDKYKNTLLINKAKINEARNKNILTKFKGNVFLNSGLSVNNKSQNTYDPQHYTNPLNIVGIINYSSSQHTSNLSCNIRNILWKYDLRFMSAYNRRRVKNKNVVMYNNTNGNGIVARFKSLYADKLFDSLSEMAIKTIHVLLMIFITACCFSIFISLATWLSLLIIEVIMSLFN